MDIKEKNMENKTNYSYSLKEVEDAKRIRKEFASEESDYERLKRIVRNAQRNATIPAIMYGIVFALVLGIGMCLTMLTSSFFILGIVIGIFGIAGVATTYPLYKWFLKKENAKIEDDVLSLSSKIIG